MSYMKQEVLTLGVAWVHLGCFVGSHGFTLVVLWVHMGSPWLFCGIHPGCFVGSHGFTQYNIPTCRNNTIVKCIKSCYLLYYLQ